MKSLPIIHRFPAITRLQRLRLALPLLSACLLLLATPAACAQLTNVTDETSVPIEGAGHDYIKLFNETVSPANGSVSLRIQLPIPKGRGITPSFSIDYDSSGVYHIESSTPAGSGIGSAVWASNSSSETGGWSVSVPSLSYSDSTVPLWTSNYDENGNPQYISCELDSGYMFTDMGGGQHALNLGTEWSGTGGCAAVMKDMVASSPQTARPA